MRNTLELAARLHLFDQLHALVLHVLVLQLQGFQHLLALNTSISDEIVSVSDGKPVP